MSKIKHPNSRWCGNRTRGRTESVAGVWNRNLHERDHTPTEATYLDSFVERYPFKHGARVRRR
jgi:hypothetical protein